LGEEVPVDAGKTQRSRHPILFFSKREKEAIVEAIRRAELRTSGEIRVHLERHVSEDLTLHAQKVFEKIGMTRTADRNGVLIFLSVADHRFVVLGDEGIHSKVSPSFWQEIASILATHFGQNRFAEGIIRAADTVGQLLAAHFPCTHRDINELPDTISCSL